MEDVEPAWNHRIPGGVTKRSRSRAGGSPEEEDVPFRGRFFEEVYGHDLVDERVRVPGVSGFGNMLYNGDRVGNSRN